MKVRLPARTAAAIALLFTGMLSSLSGQQPPPPTVSVQISGDQMGNTKSIWASGNIMNTSGYTRLAVRLEVGLWVNGQFQSLAKPVFLGTTIVNGGTWSTGINKYAGQVGTQYGVKASLIGVPPGGTNSQVLDTRTSGSA